MIDTKLFAKALKFAAHAAAKRDIRYYLLGVRLEIVGQLLTLAATDGARLALCSLALEYSAPDGAVTIGSDDVKRILSTIAKAPGSAVLAIEPSATAGVPPSLTIDAGGSSVRCKGLEGHYPDMRRVIPQRGRDQHPMPHVQPRFLAEAATALELLAGDIKGVKAIQFDAGPPGHSVVLRPVCIHEHAIKDLLVVIQPTRS